MRLLAALIIAVLSVWSNAANAAADERGYSAGHFLLSLDGKPAKLKRVDGDSPTPPQVKKHPVPKNKPLLPPRTKIQPGCSILPCPPQNSAEKK